jgi:hypothetical protein
MKIIFKQKLGLNLVKYRKLEKNLLILNFLILLLEIQLL